jgi:hypothetical protein
MPPAGKEAHYFFTPGLYSVRKLAMEAAERGVGSRGLIPKSSAMLLTPDSNRPCLDLLGDQEAPALVCVVGAGGVGRNQDDRRLAELKALQRTSGSAAILAGAFPRLVGRMRVAPGWLVVGYWLPTACLANGFGVALISHGYALGVALTWGFGRRLFGNAVAPVGNMANSAFGSYSSSQRLPASSILKGLCHSAQRWTAGGKGAAVLRWGNTEERPPNPESGCIPSRPSTRHLSQICYT